MLVVSIRLDIVIDQRPRNHLSQQKNLILLSHTELYIIFNFFVSKILNNIML